jgi:uncharacterized membrane protein
VTVAKPNRLLALIAYLVPLLGSVLLIGVQRGSSFILYHACQALAWLLGAAVVPVVWGGLGWLVAWVPLLGPVLAMFGFSLVIAAYIILSIAWVLGVVNVLRGRMNPLPLFGGWGERFFNRLAPAAAPVRIETAQPASHS